MNENDSFPYASTSREEIINRSIDAMTLLDDVFFRTVLKDNPQGAEAIVRVALDMPDVHIESVSLQHDIRFPGRKGVCLDLKARKADGTLFDIEVQKEDEGDLARRARYYLSALTVSSLGPGQRYEETPDVYVLFVCKRDPFKDGAATYNFVFRDPRVGPLDDGSRITFFNCSYQGEDAYGKLARDLTRRDYSEIDDPVLKNAVKSGKIGERRNEIVTGISKEIYDQAKAIGIEEGKSLGRDEMLESIILALLRDGSLPPERIADVLGVPLEDVLALRQREGI